MAMVAFGCLGLICNRSAKANNRFKTNQTKTPFYSIKMKASNTTDTEQFPNQFGYKHYVDSKVKQFNEVLDQTLSLHHSTKIHEIMRYALSSPGKRFRPILCLASCVLVGGDEAQAMPVSCAIEMIQAMSLMIDDLPCIDNDHIRRGMPATHKVFGEGETILAGHSLVCMAFQHIVEKTKNVGAERIVRVIDELALGTGYDGMLGGQLLDLHSEGKDVSLSELEYVHVQKSAKLIEASAVCGAIMGGGKEEEIERVRRYGRHIGVMYQVVNDILDVTKSSEELGKTAKIDLVSDKAAHPKFMGIQGAKRYADDLMAQAIQPLSYFGAARASPFYSLASYIYNQLN